MIIVEFFVIYEWINFSLNKTLGGSKSLSTQQLTFESQNTIKRVSLSKNFQQAFISPSHPLQFQHPPRDRKLELAD